MGRYLVGVEEFSEPLDIEGFSEYGLIMSELTSLYHQILSGIKLIIAYSQC